MTGIQTWILIVMVSTHSTMTVPNYGSSAECETARAYVKQQRIARRAYCIPGPVEVR